MGAALMAAAPAVAQSKLGIAVVDVEQAVATSNAYTVARTQMETTYKTQIDAFRARQSALETDLKAKQAALNTGFQAAGGKPTPALQAQYEQLQQAQQAAQQELQRLGQPIQLAQAYIEEQISAKLGDALKTTMTNAKVDLVLKPEGTVSYQPTVDITAQVKAQLDIMVPAVSITPPAGWRPGGQQAQPGAAAPAPAAPANPTKKPTGR
jgi:Skp family chaperone for outer membrane proteins